MDHFDIHIAGGTVVDGTGLPRYRGDVWIKDGRIAQIGGRAPGTSARVIDAAGHIVAPGFVDQHTHYDAQIHWDPYCTISGWHGVTSLVLGNCGFGFAPCKPEFRERSMLTMVRVEALSMDAMQAGMSWNWETIPEYLDYLDTIPKGVNVLQYMPVAPLVTYVMGLEAAKSRHASAVENAEMKRLLHEGMDAGLCGFSVQRMGPNSQQTDFDGSPMVTDLMSDESILALCEVLAERDEGFIEVAQITGDEVADRAFMEKMAEVSGRPVSLTVSASATNPEVHRRRLAWIEDCNARGLRVFGQAATLRIGFAMAMRHWNFYDLSPAWKEATTGTDAEKIAKMSDPELRARVRTETDDPTILRKEVLGLVGGHPRTLMVHRVGNHPELKQYLGRVLGDIAKEQDRHFIDVMLDLAVDSELDVEFMTPDRGWPTTNQAALINDSRYTFPGVSDGGAHNKFFNGATYSTDFLAHYVRDEKVVSLEEAHYRLSLLPAFAIGFQDRGMLRVGAPADVLVYRLEDLAVTPSWVGDIVHDLPGGDWRRVQHAQGYRAIIVNGVPTFEDGECTGATPGRLIRGGYTSV